MQPFVDVAALHPVAQVALVLAPPTVVLIKAWLAHCRAAHRKPPRGTRRLDHRSRRQQGHRRHHHARSDDVR
jgi:hypothetical protein